MANIFILFVNYFYVYENICFNHKLNFEDSSMWVFMKLNLYLNTQQTY